MPAALSTELDAINTMMAVIGESPVSTLEASSGSADVAAAKNVLAERSRIMQARAWHWNTEYNFPLTPSVPDGFLQVPLNTLRVTPMDIRFDVALRDAKLWDRINLTFVFKTPLKVELVQMLEFHDLPQIARSYLAINAARVFQDRQVGAKELAGFSAGDEKMAWAELRADHSRTSAFNMGRSPAVTRVMDRHIRSNRWV